MIKRAGPGVLCLMGCWMIAAGCGGEESQRGDAPAIKDLKFQPSSVKVGATTTVSGTVVFEDANADAESIVVRVTVPTGQSQQLPPAKAANAPGQKGGSVFFAFKMAVPAAGQYTLQLWMLDGAGHTSNKLSGTITAK